MVLNGPKFAATYGDGHFIEGHFELFFRDLGAQI